MKREVIWYVHIELMRTDANIGDDDEPVSANEHLSVERKIAVGLDEQDAIDIYRRVVSIASELSVEASQ